MTSRVSAVSRTQAAAVEEIEALLLQPGSVAVIRGGVGTGRTTALEMIGSRLADRAPVVVTVRGRSGDVGQAGEQIASMDDGAVVLLVDDADHLSEVDAAVVSAAVTRGDASAALVVADGPVPLAVTGLLRHRPPVVRRLEPLDAVEAAAFARRILGAPVAPELGSELVARTGGLPGTVAGLVAAWREAGSLSTTNGVWTATGDLDRPVDHAVADGSPAPAPAHRVEVLLALAGTLPLADIEGHVDEDALVALERRGSIEVMGEIGDEQLRLTDPDRARAVINAMDPDDRWRTLTELVDLLDPHRTGEGPTDRITVALARWRSELGEQPDAHAALRAGEAALRIGDLTTAENMAALARTGAEPVGAVLLHSAVLQRRGRSDEAHRVLREAWEAGLAPVDQLPVCTRLVDTHLHMTEDAESTYRLAVELVDRSGDDERRARLTVMVAYVAVMAGQVDLARDVLGDLRAVRAGARPDLVSSGPRRDGPVDPVESFVDLGVRALGGWQLGGWRAPDPTDTTPIGGGGLLAVDAARCFSLIPRLWSERPGHLADEAGSLADELSAGRRYLAEGWAAWIESLAALFGGDLPRARRAADRAWRSFAPLGLDSRLRAVLAVVDLVDALDPSGAPVQTDDAPLLAAEVEVPAGEIWFFRGEQLRFAALAGSVEERSDAAGSLAAAIPELNRRGLRPSAVLAECESLLLGGVPPSADRAGGLLGEAAELDRSTGTADGPYEAVAEAACAVAAGDVARQLASIDRLIELGRLLHAHLALSTIVGSSDLERSERSALLERVALVRSTSSLDPLADHEPPPLTPSETNVARLVASGMSNREAAAELGLSKKTVDNTLASAYRRLGIDDREALAILMARR